MRSSTQPADRQSDSLFCSQARQRWRSMTAVPIFANCFSSTSVSGARRGAGVPAQAAFCIAEPDLGTTFGVKSLRENRRLSCRAEERSWACFHAVSTGDAAGDEIVFRDSAGRSHEPASAVRFANGIGFECRNKQKSRQSGPSVRGGDEGRAA